MLPSMQRRPRRQAITSLTVDAGAKQVQLDEGPARWRSVEYGAYLLFVVWAVWRMTVQGQAFSSVGHPSFPRYSDELEPGWLGSIDNTDQQYRRFREGIPALVALAAVYLAVARLADRRGARLAFLQASAVVVALALHGLSVVKIIVIAGLSFAITKAVGGRRWALAPIWLYHLVVLFANELYDGYRFGSLHESLSPLDAYRGIVPRWHIGFNISVLRLISFAVDHHWAVSSPHSQGAPVNAPAPDQDRLVEEPSDEKERVRRPRAPGEYSFGLLIAYLLYPPLYIAGPIMTFNDFASQVRTRPAIPSVGAYALRFLVCLFTMEWVLHHIYANAIKDSGAWRGYSPFEVSMVGYWALVIVWLKLLIPWRFFRLWALVDGVDPPENMIRCMSNNYSTLGFWRSWHRSYNLWIVRYIYVPVGGSRNVVLATLLVFTFVALWHDLSFRLLLWGWSVTFFVVPELAAKWALPRQKWGSEWWYRHAAAFGGALNVFLMMTANLVGFAIGPEGTLAMWRDMLSTGRGLLQLLTSVAVLFAAVHLMMEYRAEERRGGVDRRC